MLINGSKPIWNVWVQSGDVITLSPKDIANFKLFELKFPIIYEDDFLAVIHKPAGYAVNGNSYQTIQNALPYNLKRSKEKDALALARPVHRLDLQTSGLLIIAKTSKAVKELGLLFENRQISKGYRCIVRGHFNESLTIKVPIDDLNAETIFETHHIFSNKFLGELTLINAFPKTGRKHQIRKHLKSLDYPILGDKVYGEYFSKGLFLQASFVSFVHPISNEIMKLQLELPKKFLNLLNHKK